MDGGFALDGYVVDELIGFGGTGEVWRAHDTETGDVVALKRLRTRGEVETERLRREGALLASVAGPHVVGVRGLIVEADEAVLVMDYAAGGSLASILGVRGSLPAAEVVTVVAPMAAALAAAHSRELVHGDLTPANILFTADGRPLLADFGLARLLGTAPRPVEGTVDYVDPAVLAGGPVTGASDVFALGVVGFTALAGVSPWGTGPPERVHERLVRGERSDLATLAPNAPAALVEVITAMLSLDPLDRPDVRSLANAVLRSGAAAPVRLVTAVPATPLPMTRQVLIRGVEQPPRSLGPDRTDRPSAVLGEIDFEPDDDPPSPLARRVLIVAGALALVAVAAAIGVGSTHLFGDAGQAAAAAVRVRPSAAARPTSSAAAARPVGSAEPAVTARPVPSATPLMGWTAVVAQLDARRARAFADADPSLLTSVYAPGVAAYSADLTTVQSLASRGVEARGFTATVDRVEVEGGTATTERLRVVDRLSAYDLVAASGQVVGQGAARPDRAFSMTLTAVAGEWRVSAVMPLHP